VSPSEPPPDPWASPSEPPPDPWQNAPARAATGGPAFGDLVAALRDVQDLVAGTSPPDAVVEAARAALVDLAVLLRPWGADEWTTPAGKRPDLPGRGHPLLPPFVAEHETDRTISGRVRFTRFYLGGNGAAHGGTIPLLFDDVLGRLGNSGGRRRARTASLLVNYRKVTPIGPELRVEGRIEREEGRKRFMSGRLLHDGELVADAEGLFVVLLPGQP